MDANTITILVIIGVYLAAVLMIGLVSARFSKKTAEDYYVANREFSTTVLFCAIFGTNISAVALIGAPGQAYHQGWVIWAYFVSAWAWLTPLLLYVVGKRAWRICKERQLITQSEFLFERFQSKPLRVISSLVLMFYTIPYITVGVIGGGRTFAGLTQGAIPYWAGALIVTVVVSAYVFVGGMRGTAWTNTFQTGVFLLGGLVIFVLVAAAFGGPAEATRQVVEQYPHLMDRSGFPMRQFFSYGIIVSLAVPMFPQVFIRILTGRSQKQLRQTAMIYPLAGIFIWFVMAYVGMWGHLAFPNLEGAASDRVLPMLLAKYAPLWVTGLLGAAIFAALMSSLDAQLLTLGTMVARDFLRRPEGGMLSVGREVRIGQGLVLAFAAIAFVTALLRPMGIIQIIEWSFGGYAAMIVPMLGAMYWRRCTAAGCIVSIVVSQVILIGIPLGIVPAELTLGTLPGLPAIVLGAASLFVVSKVTSAENVQHDERFMVLAGGRG
jgi:SSS family solute:Na+ symporter